MQFIKNNLLVIIAIIVLIISAILYLFFNNKEQREIKSGFIQGKIAYDKIENYADGIMLATKDDELLIIDPNDKVIEKLDPEATDVSILYGGYYTYKLKDKTYLNRNGKNVKTFTSLISEEFSLYKDQTDENSLYITPSPVKINEDIYYTTITQDENVKTYIYNTKTGKILFETDNYISLLKYQGATTYDYFVVGEKELIRISDFKQVFKEADVNIVGDNVKLNAQDDIITNNEKYIVISNNASLEEKKYGLLDFDGNIIIPISYDDISFKTNSTRYIAAKKEGKYGLINPLNETLLDFKYDALEVYDNNIIAVLNNRLGILNNELKTIYNYKLSLSNLEYNSRICCNNKNPFEVFPTPDNLIISTSSKNSEENTSLEFNNTLIVDKQNKVKELKKQIIRYVTDEKQVIKNSYFIKEQIDDKTLSIDIYDQNLEKLSVFETIIQDPINTVSYELFNEEYILIKIYNEEYEILSTSLVDAKSGKVIGENAELDNYLKKQSLLEDYYYYGQDDTITIKTNDDVLITTIEGKDLIYLKDSYYAVKSNNNKYYICQILLEEQVK